MTARWASALGVLLVSATAIQAVGRQDVDTKTLSVVLLLDVSASIDFRNLELPRDLSREIDAGLLAHLAPSDRFGVGVFGDRLTFGGFLPIDRRARAAAVRAALKDRSVGLNGPSRIWDAVDGIISALEKQPGRRTIILVTDGYASGNRLSLSEVIRHAKSAGVMVYVIGSGAWVLPEVQRMPGPTPRTALQTISAETGGMVLIDQVGDTFRPRHPGPLFESILGHLHGGRATSRQ